MNILTFPDTSLTFNIWIFMYRSDRYGKLNNINLITIRFIPQNEWYAEFELNK